MGSGPQFKALTDKHTPVTLTLYFIRCGLNHRRQIDVRIEGGARFLDAARRRFGTKTGRVRRDHAASISDGFALVHVTLLCWQLASAFILRRLPVVSSLCG